MAESTMRFSTKREIFMLPAPEAGKPYEHYKHATQAGFYVRVSKPNTQGKVTRLYFHRYKEPDANGKLKQVWDKLGLVEAVERDDVALKYEDALRMVLDKRRTLKQDIVEGVSTRLTVAGAWAYAPMVRQLNKDTTAEKDEKVFQRYFAHLSDRFLDDLDFAFWVSFIKQLREGTLVVGYKPREDVKDGRSSESKGMQPETRGPLSEATLVGVINIAVVLFDVANKFKGLHGPLKGTNPAAEAKGQIGTPNEKTHHIPLKDLGKALRAAQHLVAPWWRDLFYMFVLTGLRRSLVFGMRFDEIDFKNGLYIIDPLKKGTKRRKKSITASTPDIRIPLCSFLLETLAGRREFAPDPDGLVWHTPKPTRGRRVKDDKQALSDPRGAWTLISGAIGGLHFAPHDLRRTFATAAMASGADVFAVAMLMLHSGAGLAKVTQVPGITIKYMNTDEAVERMRKAAEQVSDYIGRLNAMSPEEAAKVVDPALDPMLESVLGEAA